mmetsp:Transcript_2826/g.8124  ORF Transcript_2826/g.8124 Transcript_2826/m.8124 type:complete len:215 (+) Transcript_2826:135-779(+)
MIPLLRRRRALSAGSRCRPFQYTFAPFSGKNNDFQVKIPGPKLKSWESGAKLVKNTKVENQYVEHIREIHDPSMHIKTIEDELKGTIGKALGKQGEKVLMYMRAMEQQQKEYLRLLEETGDPTDPAVEKCVEKHNEYRNDCVKARWELIVHRQAVGFIVGNHKFVMEKFPIGDALPTAEQLVNRQTEGEETSEKPKPKQFTDQLDWWQRIGRWR